jgi:hypothetical protein
LRYYEIELLFEERCVDKRRSFSNDSHARQLFIEGVASPTQNMRTLGRMGRKGEVRLVFRLTG